MNELRLPAPHRHGTESSQWEPGLSAALLTTRWVPQLVGGLLVAAGLLKTHQLLTSPPPAEPVWFTLLLIGMEARARPASPAIPAVLLGRLAASVYLLFRCCRCQGLFRRPVLWLLWQRAARTLGGGDGWHSCPNCL